MCGPLSLQRTLILLPVTRAGTFGSIWATEGFRGLYRGLGPTIFGYLPTWAIYFTVYDKVKANLGASRGEYIRTSLPCFRGCVNTKGPKFSRGKQHGTGQDDTISLDL